MKSAPISTNQHQSAPISTNQHQSAPISTVKLTFLFFLALTFFSINSNAQFWTITGDSAQNLSANLFRDLKIDINQINNNILQLDKNSPAYKKQDSLKLETKSFKIDFDLFNFKTLSKVLNSNVFIEKFTLSGMEQLDFQLEKIKLSDDAKLYFVAGNFNEFSGPINNYDLNKKEQNYLHTGFFSSNDVYIILVENNTSKNPKSKFRITESWFIEKNTNSKAKVNGPSPNAACYPEYNDLAYSVGKSYNNARKHCTFAVINNEKNDRTPLFLTARHCIATNAFDLNLDPSDIATLVNTMYIIPRRYLCNTTTEEPYRWNFTGATYLASQWPSDHLLVKNNYPLPINISYLGWDRTNYGNQTPVFSLHNPGGSSNPVSVQRLSIGTISGTSSVVTGSKYQINWTLGETVVGSSGGPLFNSTNRKIIGALSYELGTSNYYKIANAWSTSTYPLKAHLSPSFNLTSINTLNPLQINGPNILCYNQSATLTMPNLLFGENMTWTVSNGLQILSSNGYSVVVKANNPSFIGQVTVTANFNTQNFPTAQLLPQTTQFSFWVGLSNVTITNSTTSHTVNSGSSINMSQSSTNVLKVNNVSQITAINWNFPASWSKSGTTGSPVSVYSFTSGSPFSVSLTNLCGTSSGSFFVSPVAIIKPATVYPNIASDDISISFSKKENGFYEIPEVITIIDPISQRIVNSKNIDANDITADGILKFSLRGLDFGQVIIHLNFGERIESNKILIIK
jgi:PKD-like domain